VISMASRFLNLLKSRQIGGTNQATANELDSAADPVFLEPKNLGDILQVGHINKAIQTSRQNGGMPKGSLSVVETVSISDSITDLVKPSDEQVYQIQSITLKAAGGGSDIAYQVYLSDGTTSAVIAAGTAGAGGSTVIFSPINADNSGGVPFNITSGCYLVAQAASTLPADVSYHVLQS